MPMNSNSPFGNPFMQRISEEAANFENVIDFQGNILEVDRRHVTELQQIAGNEECRTSEREAAQEQLDRYARYGSKAAAQALSELGLGNHAMSPAQFDLAVRKLHLDAITERKIRALGPKFFEFAAKLGEPADPLAEMQLQDFISMCGRDAASEFIAHVADSQAEAINLEFIALNPDYYRSEGNREALINYLGVRHLGRSAYGEASEQEIVNSLLAEGHYSADELSEAWEAIKTQGAAEFEPGTVRPINPDDLEALSLAAAACSDPASLDRLLTFYVQRATGDDSITWRDCIKNRAYTRVANDAAFFAWAQKRADYRPSEGARQYIQDYLCGRFPTFDLLSAGWDACKEETGGRGSISGIENQLQEIESDEQHQIEEINRRYTVG